LHLHHNYSLNKPHPHRITRISYQAIMDLYKIVGLNVTTETGNSYKTVSPHSNAILHDDAGKGVVKHHVFTKYIMYIAFGHSYYAIHLSESHSASFVGQLCSIGTMRTTKCCYKDVMENITHVPTSPIYFVFKIYSDDEKEEENVYVYNDPDICVFQFSRDGNDEQTPSGFVYVNMELFVPK